MPTSDDKQPTIADMKDHLMVIMNNIELIKLSYGGLMDNQILVHVDRIERSAMKISDVIKKVENDPKKYFTKNHV